MKYIISRYNHDTSWIPHYTDDVVMYDRSRIPLKDAINVPNIGTDIYDKFTYIIDNYDNLPDVAVYTKCNLFKYVSEEEFQDVKDNTTFTPLLTKRHKVYDPICYYKDGIYWERNNLWFLGPHPAKHDPEEVMKELGTYGMEYIPFAPGSNYILPKENILKHPKEKYEKLRNYLDWDVYPGEAQIIERGLYTLWR